MFAQYSVSQMELVYEWRGGWQLSEVLNSWGSTVITAQAPGCVAAWRRSRGEAEESVQSWVFILPLNRLILQRVNVSSGTEEKMNNSTERTTSQGVCVPGTQKSFQRFFQTVYSLKLKFSAELSVIGDEGPALDTALEGMLPSKKQTK